MKKCVIIYNHKSGQAKKDYTNIIKETIKEYGYDPIVITTKYKGHAIELVSLVDKVDLIIAVGGDGTYNEVVTGNLKRNNPLLVGHIPIGITNDISKMYGYTKNIKKNIEMLMTGTKKEIDICTINDRPTLYTACLGKFTDAFYVNPREKRNKLGNIKYLLDNLKDELYHPKMYELTYRVNNETHTGKYSLIIISSANKILGIDKFYQDVKLNDNQFEILFCKFKSQRDIIKNFYNLKKGKIKNLSGFEFHTSDEIEINFKDKAMKTWHIDGEECKTNQCSFNIKNTGKMETLLPKINLDKLFEK